MMSGVKKKDFQGKKKGRKRSAEAKERHRKRYQEILERRSKISKQVQDSIENKSGIARLQKKLICKYFYRTGSCIHGQDCNFSHECIPLNSKNIKLCQFFIKSPSECKYSAEECRYSHEPKLFLCRLNVINGSCENRSCPFNHLPMNEIEKCDETEKLKFCYNNKHFLTNLLINKLNQTRDPDDQIPTGANGKHQLDQIVAAVQKTSRDSLPWYLNFMTVILERDFEMANCT
ncbi:bifunctional Zinc finger [Babesia duncani]|uniref:Bifunctional Zinc finger n=1 Tax=Babesia duncani TaxID=323732 RepID=A0AAD9PP41_9APIC|nr:bifunctional Zinc finger [Babesia duncani]